jgi:hypothetical protein
MVHADISRIGKLYFDRAMDTGPYIVSLYCDANFHATRDRKLKCISWNPMITKYGDRP